MSKLQVGESGAVKLVASTVAEIENLMPWLAECKREGREVNVSCNLFLQLLSPRFKAFGGGAEISIS